MKKLILILFALMLTSFALAYDVPKNEEYYKTQIQNQRFLYSMTGLCNAIQKGNSEVVELFMQAGFSPNGSYAGTPLAMFALYQKQINSFKVLLKYGADPETTIPPLFVSIKSQNLLSYAIKKKSSEAVKCLIENNADVNKVYNNRTPLNYALQTRQPVVVEMLLQAGAIPDEKTYKLVNKSKDAYIKDLFAEYKNKDEK